MRLRILAPVLSLAAVPSACADRRAGSAFDSNSGVASSGTDGGISTASSAGSGGADSDASTTGAGSSDGGSGEDPKFDVGAGSASASGGDGTVGCKKVDFLFLVDNSGSMADEQDNLVAAFPSFIDTISSTLQAQDYHLMVIDTDSFLDGGNCNGNPDPSCCAGYCAANPLKLCGGNTCPGIDACMAEIGSGRVVSQSGADCGVAGAEGYIVDGQPNLVDTFACVATVGTGGDGREIQMQALQEALTTQEAPGACNEGFLRHDAILVITIITDEEDDPNDGGDDDPNSPGDPTSWHDAAVAVKNGDPTAVVVLGLVGDTDLPGATCVPLANGVGAEPAPRLRAFVDSFGGNGMWASVCEPDYGPMFEQAVSVIDTTCDDFVPPG